MSRCVIVLGLPRSGTSAVAGTLHRLGVDMGEGNLQVADELNPRGYYEDTRWQRIHKTLAGKIYSTKFMHTCPRKQAGQYARLIDKLKKLDLWGFKTPRACFTLHHITPLLKRAGVDTCMIVVQREYSAVVSSMQRHSELAYGGQFKMTAAQALKLMDDWNAAFEYQLAHFHDLKISIDFEKLLDEPLNTAETLAEFCGLDDYGALAAIEWLDRELVTQ